MQFARQHVEYLHTVPVAELGQSEVLEGVDGEYLFLCGGGAIGLDYEAEPSAQEQEAETDGSRDHGVLRLLEFWVVHTDRHQVKLSR